jgi:putative endonuclease
MAAERRFFVYIMSSLSRTLFVGSTNDLHRRVHQHKAGAIKGFSSRYNVNRLVYYEFTSMSSSSGERVRNQGLGSREEVSPH